MADWNIDLKKLSAEERMALLEEIWESLTPDEAPLTDAHRKELDLRLDDLEGDSDPGIPWEEVRQRIRDRRR